MKPTWHFRSYRPTDTTIDPIAKALFSQDAVESAAASVVRESIQNSLDAGQKNDAPVRVRFALRRGRMAASANEVAPFLDPAFQHLNGQDTGLDVIPVRGRSVDFLAIEDFNTKGLVGATDQWDPFESRKNSFFLFFRALGRSGKSGEDRGRWGVGKYVFPLASHGNCWFGLTVPNDTMETRLMGRIVLKTHRVDGKSYHPDGHWGIRPEDASPVLPLVGDDDQVAAFRRCFAVSRTYEPGLSVVVPWLRSDVSVDDIRHAIVREYFLPILEDKLSVEIDDNGAVELIRADSLERLALSTEDPFLINLVALGSEAVTIPQRDIVRLKRADLDGGPVWDDGLVSEEQRNNALESLDTRKLVAFSVPVAVREKDGASQLTQFSVFLRTVDGLGRQRPMLVREGITIPEAEMKSVHDHIALVVVNERPLATLVGDAETPAHTQLHHQLIKDKYVKAKQYLTLLREAPHGFLRAIASATQEDDPFLLSAFFPLASDPSDRGRTSRTNVVVGPEPAPPIVEVPRRKPRAYRVDATEGGFSIKGTGEVERLPAQLSVACAYDVRRGNPLTKYDPLDFSLDESLSIQDDGVEILLLENNRLVMRPLRSDFDLSVRGFDVNRNLFVRVTAAE